MEEGGRANGVRLAGGELLPAQMVVVGIGIVPAVEPLIEAGTRGLNGVKVDGNAAPVFPTCSRSATARSTAMRLRTTPSALRNIIRSQDFSPARYSFERGGRS